MGVPDRQDINVHHPTRRPKICCLPKGSCKKRVKLRPAATSIPEPSRSLLNKVSHGTKVPDGYVTRTTVRQHPCTGARINEFLRSMFHDHEQSLRITSRLASALGGTSDYACVRAMSVRTCPCTIMKKELAIKDTRPL